MNTLQTIQKTFRVFHVLAKIAFIFSIVGAALCAVGALCAVSGLTVGTGLTVFGQPVMSFGSSGVHYALAALLSDMVILISDAVLLGFTGRYLALELTEGTPFTENGANTLRRLGIRYIYIPIVSAVIASVIIVAFDAEPGRDISNLPELTTGIAFILTSLIFRYGAELERKSNTETLSVRPQK